MRRRGLLSAAGALVAGLATGSRPGGARSAATRASEVPNSADVSRSILDRLDPTDAVRLTSVRVAAGEERGLGFEATYRSEGLADPVVAVDVPGVDGVATYDCLVSAATGRTEGWIAETVATPSALPVADPVPVTFGVVADGTGHARTIDVPYAAVTAGD